MRLRILLIDQDPHHARRLAVALYRAGCICNFSTVGNGHLSHALASNPDAIVFSERIEVRTACRISQGLRRMLEIPIIIELSPLADRRRLRDWKSRLQLHFIEAGQPAVLAAKLCAMLARTAPHQPTLTCGPLTLHPAGRWVLLQGQPLALTPLEFDLLHRLMREPNRIIRGEMLIREVWGETLPTPALHTLHCHITALRRKLGSFGRIQLITIRKKGYLFRSFEPSFPSEQE